MTDVTTSVTTDLTPQPDPAQVPRLRAAYLRQIDKISAVPDSALVPITVDIQTAVTIVLGALPGLRSLAGEMAKRVPSFDPAILDELEEQALALGHAHARYAIASSPPNSLRELSERGTALRARLYSDFTPLAERGLIPSEPLKEVKGPNGYRNVAFDLESMSALGRDNWDKIQGKTAITLEQLTEAENIADAMLTTVGVRDHGPATVQEAGDIRARAYSLLFGTYDELRRDVSYLRWQERDVETIVPSFFSGRTRRRTGDDEVDEAQSDLPPVVPSPQPAEPQPAQAAPAAPPAAAGLPGAAPFAQS